MVQNGTASFFKETPLTVLMLETLILFGDSPTTPTRSLNADHQFNDWMFSVESPGKTNMQIVFLKAYLNIYTSFYRNALCRFI